MKAAKMRFLRPLLGLKMLDRRRNCNIRNRLKINNIAHDFKAHKKKWLDRLKRMDMDRLPRLALQYHQPKGRRKLGQTRRRWKDQVSFEL